MGQREPDGADLLPSRRQAVDDPARDDEMAASVVVAERQAEPVIVKRDDCAGESRNDGERDRKAAAGRRYTHVLSVSDDGNRFFGTGAVL